MKNFLYITFIVWLSLPVFSQGLITDDKKLENEIISSWKKKKFFEVVQYVHHPLFTRLKSVIKNNSIGTVIKHIPGHGLAKVDSHHFTPIVDKSFDYLKKK